MNPVFKAAKNDAQIGYILKGYLRTSETFITNEIRLLEKMGVGLSIFSVKKLEGQKNHAMVKDIKAPVTYLPQADPLSEARFSRWIVDNVPKFSTSHAMLFKKKPLAYLKVFLECLVMSIQYRNGLFDLPREVFFKEFLQAGYIANAVIESGQIQHLHAHFCHGSTTIAMFASRMSGIPFSFTAHAKDIYLKELNPGKLLQKKMRRAEFLVTCTGANEKHLQRMAPKGTKIHKIYHGLDTKLFANSAQDSPITSDEAAPIVLSVGRLVEKKGFDYLVKACAILKERGRRFRCQIVGGGDGYTEILVNLIKELDLEDTVSLLGAVTQEELREIYQQATLFALPCLVVDNGDRDGIPNVLVEAMSMRVPVISTDISGIPELIDNNLNGLLVPEKNAVAMANAIERLLINPALRQQLGDAGRGRVCKDFDSQVTTLDLKDFLSPGLYTEARCYMSAVPSIDNSFCIEVLEVPFNAWSPSEVLAYFQSRKGIAYFAIANEPEVFREKIDNILINNFNFNEETYQFQGQVDWLNNPSIDIEWAIMLHKFYYVVGLGIAFKETGDRRYAEAWVGLTSSWITTVPVDFLSSDVTGRRIQNWVFAHYYFISECPSESVTPEFYVQFLTSIHQQTSYLCQHLTPARNHRTLELYTIFLVAVVFPELKGADSWLRFSIDELLKNMQTDMLDDGVHCELSTDYHHIVLRNFLAVRRLAAMNYIDLPKQMDGRIKKALEFSLYVHKPDGTIPSLSDGDTGCFLSLLQQGYDLYGCEEMLYVATQGKQGIPPTYRSKAFPYGGYYILRSGWGESAKPSPEGEAALTTSDASEPYEDERYLVFDCGDLGAGNHGHLDLLSFEMAAYGKSLIVDPGRYTYDESGEINWRVLFRGTSYHNTVVVDGKNQALYEFHKEKFKIKGPQPDYELKAFLSRPGFDYLHGVAHSHEYPVVHERKILFVNGEYWVICDVLRADDIHNYDLLFHLSVSAQGKVLLNSDQHFFLVDAPHLVMMQPVHQSATVSLEGGYVSPTYGVKQEAPVIKFNQQGAECCFYTVLFPYKNKRPTLTVTSIPVFRDHETCEPFAASCLGIISETEEHVFRDMVFVANGPGEYTVDHYTINSPVFFQREDEQGQLFAQFDYSSLDTPPEAIAFRQGS